MARITHKRGVSVNVDGLEKLRSQLEEMPEQVRQGAGDAIEESAGATEGQMKDDVPQDSGTLHDAIRSYVSRSELTADVGPMGDEAYYGHFVEFGTSSQAAQPFANPAAEQERGRFPGRLREHVGEYLR